MQEFIILLIKYKFFILVTALTGLHIFFVVKRKSLMKQVRHQVSLIEQLCKTNDSKTIDLFHKELQKQTEVCIWIKQSWERFNQAFHRNQTAGSSMIPSIEDHFDEYGFTQELGNRKVIEWVPGIFLGIGILSTFLGLTLSIPGLYVDFNQMPYLMNGIGFAFVGSITVIGLSLYWQISNDRTYYPFLLQQYDKFLNVLQRAFPSEEPTLKSQLEDFKTFLADGFQQMNETFTSHLQATQSMMKETLTRNTENQTAVMEKMAHQLVESLEEPMQQLGKTLHQSVEWQEKIHSDMAELVKSLQNSVTHQTKMVEKTTVLATEIQQNAKHLSKYQAALQPNITKLNETTNEQRELQMIFADLLSKITAERQQIEQQLIKQLQQMDDRAAQLKEHWSDTHCMIKDVNEQLSESTDRFVQHMHSGLEQTFTQFDTALTNAIRTLASGVGTLETLFQELPIQVEQLNHQVGEINGKLSKSISDANESILQAIQEVQHQTVLSQKSRS